MLSLSLSVQNPTTVATDILVLPYFANQKNLHPTAAQLDQKLDHKISHLQKATILTGKVNSLTVIPGFNGIKANFMILVGLGDSKKLTSEILRKAAGTVVRKAQELQAKTMLWTTEKLPFSESEIVKFVAEGSVMGGYRFIQFKSKAEDPPTLKNIQIQVQKESTQLKQTLELGRLTGVSVNIARDLANTPANHLTPTHVVEWAKKQFQSEKSIQLDIIDAKQAKSLGMNLFLGVAQGSSEPPYMLVLKYLPNKNEKPIALVGKGVTFDTGGISIKPAAKMSEMKGDMSGAAAVLATMVAVTKLKPNKNIIGIVGLTENMPSGNAYKPSDVLTAMNGKTVEITNTDAEGRLVLADALCYAVSQNAKEIVDLATLTGACSVALGDVASAILGNNDSLIQRWLEISKETGERLWQLPLYDEYFDYLKSDTADMVNASEGRLAGTCTGAKFLEQFVADTPWVHLDIASMMHYSSTSGYTIQGMSGVGVRNLLGYILEMN